MNAKISFHTEKVEGQEITYKTVGVLILTSAGIVYVPVVEEVAPTNLPNNKLAVEVEDAVNRGLDPEDIFNYYIERTNGITESFSNAETVKGKDLDEIKEKALGKIRY